MAASAPRRISLPRRESVDTHDDVGLIDSRLRGAGSELVYIWLGIDINI